MIAYDPPTVSGKYLPRQSHGPSVLLLVIQFHSLHQNCGSNYRPQFPWPTRSHGSTLGTFFDRLLPHYASFATHAKLALWHRRSIRSQAHWKFRRKCSFCGPTDSPAANEDSNEKTCCYLWGCGLLAQAPRLQRICWPIMGSPASREHVRRLRIRLAALRRQEAARDPTTGKSALAVAAGQASARNREGDRAWGLELALKRWYPRPRGNMCESNEVTKKS